MRLRQQLSSLFPRDAAVPVNINKFAEAGAHGAVPHACAKHCFSATAGVDPELQSRTEPKQPPGLPTSTRHSPKHPPLICQFVLPILYIISTLSARHIPC